MELEEVVGGGDEAPFRVAGGSAAALEAVEAAVELRVREHRLDGFLSSSVERFAELGLEHGAHERVGAAVPARPGAFALVGVGRDEHRDALAGDVLDLLLVPVAGVGDDHAGLLGDAGRVEFCLCGVDHWAEMSEVWRVGIDLRGDHDLVLVDDGLGVVALDVAARCLEVLGVRVGHVHLPGRGRGRLVGLGASCDSSAGRACQHRARGRPRRHRSRGARSTALPPAAAWPPSPAPAATRGTGLGLAARSASSRFLASCSHARRPSAVASSGGNSSPRRSP